MNRIQPLIAALLLAGCAAESPPAADPQVVEAAVEHAQLEMERANGVDPAATKLSSN